MPDCGSGAFASSSFLLFDSHLGHLQAETPLNALSRFAEPPLLTRPGYAEGANAYAFDAFLSDWPIHDNAAMVDILKAQSGVATLPRQHRSSDGSHPDNSPPTAYPMLVTFKNLANPKSVVAVDPDHLDSPFGPGIRLKRITVQMTEDSVTNGIEKRLQWLGTTVTEYLDGQFAGGGPVTSFKQSN